MTSMTAARSSSPISGRPKGIVLGVLLGVTGATGMFLRHDARITIDGRLNSPYISHHGGTAYLHLTLATSDFRTAQRRPMNLAVVLDRSGSMESQEKMEHAKSALRTLINSLQSEVDHHDAIFLHARV